MSHSESFEKMCKDFFYHNNDDARKIMDKLVNATILTDREMDQMLFEADESSSECTEQTGSFGFICRNGKFYTSEENAISLTQIRNRVRKEFHWNAQLERNLHLFKNISSNQTMKSKLIKKHKEHTIFAVSKSNHQYILECLTLFLQRHTTNQASQLFIQGLHGFLEKQIKHSSLLQWHLPSALFTEISRDGFMEDAVKTLVSFTQCLNLPDLAPSSGQDLEEIRLESLPLLTFQLDQSISDDLIKKMAKSLRKHINFKNAICVRFMGDVLDSSIQRCNLDGRMDEKTNLLLSCLYCCS
mmetsp:Transcript_2363/g.3323  ORF Transcript_2363/g.3323 Transcript_2363/m.3323 type:complete len:299 (-) Transcript_2363:218-1114(-)